MYHNLTEGGSAMAELCRLACKEDHLDLCRVSESPMLGDARWIVPTVWRFMPLVDGQVRGFFASWKISLWLYMA